MSVVEIDQFESLKESTAKPRPVIGGPISENGFVGFGRHMPHL